jgi:ribosomal protein S18 acetylase RimI-like enzyme
MTPVLQFEILDLRHFSANSLRHVLEQESLVWSERLRWDYRASADLLLQYLDSRVLPGYVAVENGRVTGYVFCVYEDSKAVIGDVFASPSRPAEATASEVECRLLEHLIELLQNSPGMERIESQLLLHPHRTHALTFERAGFRLFRRLFLELDLTPAGRQPWAGDPRPLPANLELRRWDDKDFAAAGRLIAAAYEDHLDSFINDQYRSTAGSLRFLHNIVRFPGCGLFDAASSRVIVDRSSNEMVGLLLCSRVREDVGHVTQICVAKSYRGLGLGTVLLDACVTELRNRRFQALTLTVTEANQSAVSLYRKMGFAERHSFDAMVWEKPVERRSRI